MYSRSLNKIEDLTSSISDIPWFKSTGKNMDSLLKKIVKNYCKKIGISEKIKNIRSWEDAIQIINSDKWNRSCWELEEKEKSNLVNILLKNISEKELFNCLNILTIETTKIIEKYSIENLKKNDTKYHYFTKVAAGSAAISCYQAALAIAANKDPNHIFISKFQLFKAGHWPLIVTDNSLNIF